VNVEIELTLKIRACDESTKIVPTPKRWMIPALGRILNKIASHPCVLIILREFTKR
jgi:hypothetical protein